MEGLRDRGCSKTAETAEPLYFRAETNRQTNQLGVKTGPEKKMPSVRLK
jgi:hypothetical protein